MQSTNSNGSSYKVNGSVNGNGNGNGKLQQLYPLTVLQSPPVEETDEGLDLRGLLTVVKHRIGLIGLFAVGVTAAVGIWTFKQEPRYSGDFNLLVGSTTAKNNDSQLGFLGGGWESVDFDTQIEVLTSPSVLEPIVERLQDQYPEIDYGYLVEGKRPRLQIEQVDDTKILNIYFEDEDPEKIDLVLEQLAQVYLNYSLEERQAEINQGLEFVESQLPQMQARVDQMLSKVQEFRQTHNLIDPQDQASMLANQLVEVENRYLDTQVAIGETSLKYNLLEQQLGIEPDVAIASNYLTESPRYQKLLNQLQQVEIDLAQNRAVFQDESPVIIELQEKRNNLLPLLEQEAEIILGSRYGDTLNQSTSLANPSSLRLDLSREYVSAANQMQVLEVRRRSLEQAQQNLSSQIKQMPNLVRQYMELQRELNTAIKTFDSFSEAKETLKLEGAQQALPWRLIAKPQTYDGSQVYPRPTLNLSLGLVSGLLLGLGAALLAERLDPVFHSTDEVKEASQTPLLGVIPLAKEVKPLAAATAKMELPPLQVGNNPVQFKSKAPTETPWSSSPFEEAFRSLNTNIRLLGSDSPINSVVVSSSVPAEGKSTVSAHLAQAAAAMGQKVLIVDADLRRPQVHHWMGIENKAGLSNVLATGLNIDDAIMPVPQWPNLYVLTAGDIPPDPTRLLSSKRMQQLQEELQQRQDFDLVIFDTPPLLGFADGRILAAHTNGVVLVLRMGKTDRSVFKQNLDALKTAHVPILGIIANGTSGRHSHGHYYSRYYKRK